MRAPSPFSSVFRTVRETAGALIGVSALVGAVACGGGKLPPPTPPAAAAGPALPAGVAACGARPWLRTQPEAEEEWIFGTGYGPDVETAERRARDGAAASLSVDVRQETNDRQVDWQAQRGRAAAAGGFEQKIEVASRSLVARRMENCRTDERCTDGGGVHALVRCSRRSALDRELRKAAEALGRLVPEQASVVVIPATRRDGYITGLGEYASSVVEEVLGKHLPKGARVRDLPPWDSSSIHEVARKHKISHSVQMVHLDAPGRRVRFQARLVELATEQPVPGTQHAFEIELEPGHMELLGVRGPLFANKHAWDLAANKSGRPAELRVKKAALVEGEEVEIEFKLPRASYVYLFDIYEDGRASLLLPNPIFRENKLAAGKYTLPDKAWRERGLVLTACPMPGSAETRENLKLITSPVPLDLDVARFFADAGAKANEEQVSLRDVAEKLDELRDQGVPFAEATAPYVVRADGAVKSACRK